ncbi:unnamed protein product [Moneuplotes crassus]|uniref:Uncharacterized protein n=1 Tax=Euplotes crassus TaxID=5936 RepID=A0AAD2CYN4_EUPCR|nr:unnamed protein product [Moneuplotes crassus]
MKRVKGDFCWGLRFFGFCVGCFGSFGGFMSGLIEISVEMVCTIKFNCFYCLDIRRKLGKLPCFQFSIIYNNLKVKIEVQ